MNSQDYLANVSQEFKQLRALAEKALQQVNDRDFFIRLDSQSNNIAVIVKHLAGNLHSRWTDFLTTDGEKPDRHRDTEFVLTNEDTRESLTERWTTGWAQLFAALEELEPDNLGQTIYIRTKPLTVFAALHRQLTHYAAHVGQITYLARHFAGDKWQTLSIPPGKSAEFNLRKRKK